MQALTLTDATLRPMCAVALHESLVDGLRSTGAFSGDLVDAEAARRLDEWADQSDNPTGQKANLARCVAALARVSELQIERSSAAVGTFWDATR